MATNNAVNTSLNGQTGTGSFVGSINPSINNVSMGYTTTVTSGGTTTLTASSNRNQFFTGTSSQTVVLPNATTMQLGQSFVFTNDSALSINIQTSGAIALFSILPGMPAIELTCVSNSTTDGTWSNNNLIGPAFTGLTTTGNAIFGTAGVGMTVSGGGTNSSITYGGNLLITPSITGGHCLIASSSGGSNIAAGNIGYSVKQSFTSGLGLTTNTVQNITTLSLNAGGWQINGNVFFTGGATTVVTILNGWLNTTSATSPGTPNFNQRYYGSSGLTMNGAMESFSVPEITFFTATGGTVYLSCVCTFTTSTLTAYGNIVATCIQ